MARVCEICGKGTQVGNSVEIRGKAKYLGGVVRRSPDHASAIQAEPAAGEDYHAPMARTRRRVSARSALRSGAVQRVVPARSRSICPAADKSKGEGPS